jgi:hypothetical protein
MEVVVGFHEENLISLINFLLFIEIFLTEHNFSQFELEV